MKALWTFALTTSGILAMALLARGTSGEETGGNRQGDRRRGQERPGVFLTDVPPYPGNVILGRPTRSSVTLSILLHQAAKVRVAYGPAGADLSRRTAPLDLKAGEPAEVNLENLDADTSYQYRVLDAESGKGLLPETRNGAFRTGRRPEEPFTFTIQSDSHLDGGSVPAVYMAALANALADGPDFHLDLGDTFMTGKHESRESALRQYAAQRYYLGRIAHSAPLFLVLGNHDGEEASRPGASGESGLAVWSCLQRKRLFPNPVPGPFYSGNAERHPEAGPLQNYYAWTWGSALFVVLDPYWTSGATRAGQEPWNATLGKRQYEWLRSTLSGSSAKYKFIFIHQLTGGVDRAGRGGAEAALLFEWGGRERDGRETFSVNRPGWAMPIHQLLKQSRVTAVFHGHDHFFAKQELDGVIYQLLPQPSHRNFRTHHAEEYGYKQGVFLPSSGHIRVRVAPRDVQIDYVRAAPSDGPQGEGPVNGRVEHSYSVRAKVESSGL